MSSGSQVKVLIIEDERPVRESFRNYLDDLGYETIEAVDGQDGLKLFKEHRPNAVILDLRMPRMSGHEVMRTLAGESPTTPIIVASGTGNISDTVEALHLGAWDYLLKPVTDLTMLQHALKQVLERARMLTENREYQERLEAEVERRTRELTEKIHEMSRFNKMAMGRERRIIELKRIINELLNELGREPKFKSPELIEEDGSLIE